MERETKHIFTWTIENFKFCTQKNGEFLESPAFMADNLDETTWCVRLYPRGDKVTSKEFISCYLNRSMDCAGPDAVLFDLNLEAIDGYDKVLKQFQCTSKYIKSWSIFGCSKFLKRKLLLDSNMGCPDDILSIRVTLKKLLPNLFTQTSCWTKIATDNFSFEWKVKNCISSTADVRYVSVSETLQYEITIKIPEDDVEISIRRQKGFDESQKLECCVTLLDLEGKNADYEEVFFKTDDPDKKDTWKFPNFLKQSKLTSEKEEYLDEDYFTLRFNFALSNGIRKDIVNRSLDFFLKTEEDFSASLKTDLKLLLTNPVHADVELHADEKLFRVHKSILCARSPVFMAMFNQDMIEKQTGVIKITDMEARTLNSLLEFMYTGDTEIANYESALKLLLAADKYQVLSLKEKCTSFLKSSVSDENVCRILYTSDLIQQESLKICAVNHIKENYKKVFKSGEWKQLVEKNFELATETFSEVSIY